MIDLAHPETGFKHSRIIYDIDYFKGDCQALFFNKFTSVCVIKFSALAILGSLAKI